MSQPQDPSITLSHPLLKKRKTSPPIQIPGKDAAGGGAFSFASLINTKEPARKTFAEELKIYVHESSLSDIGAKILTHVNHQRGLDRKYLKYKLTLIYKGQETFMGKTRLLFNIPEEEAPFVAKWLNEAIYPALADDMSLLTQSKLTHFLRRVNGHTVFQMGIAKDANIPIESLPPLETHVTVELTVGFYVGLVNPENQLHRHGIFMSAHDIQQTK